MAPLKNREHRIVLFGASGYTGKYTAEAIVKFLPTDLQWAIAGRNESKLNDLAAELKKINPDRKAPTIETCSLDLAQLEKLAKKTELIINAVGPYSQYGEPVVKACVKNGTHYLDTYDSHSHGKGYISSLEQNRRTSMGATNDPKIRRPSQTNQRNSTYILQT